MGWSTTDIPDQTGRVVVITGANSGIGLEAAKALSRKGARVVMACRNLAKAEAARAEVGGTAEVRELDVSDLSSVRAFAGGLDGRIDVLINNAGIMAVPQARTTDGFESQLGTNFLGHFALTGLLLPRVSDRVVTLSSMAHRFGRVNLADPNFEHRRYQPWVAYGQSKLADLMFAFNLQRRLLLAGSTVRSVAAHPGYATTNLQAHLGGAWAQKAQDLLARVSPFVQSAADGALPSLYAATAPDVPGGSYVGPSGLGETTGPPVLVGSSRASRDVAVQRGLWDLATRLTGVDFALPAHP
ncbi:oxidoreductase [Lapillicoccus sp.]|uniref:oxidoreductase n=1 Tax=Lapillicoccus sp. TaxID=1909287 RepID=UPI003982F6AA